MPYPEERKAAPAGRRERRNLHQLTPNVYMRLTGSVAVAVAVSLAATLAGPGRRNRLMVCH